MFCLLPGLFLAGLVRKRYSGKADEGQNSTWKTMKLNLHVCLGNGQNTCPSFLLKRGFAGNKQRGGRRPNWWQLLPWKFYLAGPIMSPRQNTSQKALLFCFYTLEILTWGKLAVTWLRAYSLSYDPVALLPDTLLSTVKFSVLLREVWLPDRIMTPILKTRDPQVFWGPKRSCFTLGTLSCWSPETVWTANWHALLYSIPFLWDMLLIERPSRLNY